MSARSSKVIAYAWSAHRETDNLRDAQMRALQEYVHAAQGMFIEQCGRKNDNRPILRQCIATLAAGDTIAVWRLDRLHHNAGGVAAAIDDIHAKGANLHVIETPTGALTLPGEPANDASPLRQLVHALGNLQAPFAAHEPDHIQFTTFGPRVHRMTANKIDFAQRVVRERRMTITMLCQQLGVSRQCLYHYISPQGELRPRANMVLRLEEAMHASPIQALAS